jgi:hypothetical protein
MERIHPFFNVNTFDKAYNAVSRSKKLSWNQKALINRVITWQESTNLKTGELLGYQCEESNSTLCYELGMAESTLKKAINDLSETSFFRSVQYKKRSKAGKFINCTRKTVDMEALVAFLEAEEQEQADTSTVKKEVRKQAAIAPQQPPSKTPEPMVEEVPVQPVLRKDSIPFEKAEIELEMMFTTEMVFLSKEEASIQLRVEIGNHPKISPEKKYILNEWVTAFMDKHFDGFVAAYHNAYNQPTKVETMEEKVARTINMPLQEPEDELDLAV